MKIKFYVKTIMIIFLLGLIPLYFYAAEMPDGLSKKTPAPKEEIIQLLQEKNEASETKKKNNDKVFIQPKSIKSAEIMVAQKEEDGEHKVYFSKGSHTLGANAKKVLNEVAVWLAENQDVKIIIEGHGNENKSSERNLILGELRAGSVLSYLVKQGIDETRLTVVSYGSERSKDWRNRKRYGVKNWRVCLLVNESEDRVTEKKMIKKEPVVPERKPVKSETKAEKTVAKETRKDKKPVVAESKPVEPQKKAKKTVTKAKSRDKKPVVSKTQTTGSVEGKQTAKTKKVIIPNQGWEINFDAPTILEQYDSSKKSGYYYQGIAEAGFNISISVEKKQGSKAGHMAVYDYYWPLAKKNSFIDINSIKMSKHDKFIQVEYVIKGENKKIGTFEMPHVNYYFEFNNKWIDVHVSKLPFKKSEEILFKKFTDTLSYKNSN